MAGRILPRKIDEYISGAAPKSQSILQQIRKTIREAAPRAEECISYGMPAFKLGGTIVYFAAFKKHIGLYPPVRANTQLLREVKEYAGEKGNLQFPLNKPIPYALIRRIVKARLFEKGGRSTARNRS